MNKQFLSGHYSLFGVKRNLLFPKKRRNLKFLTPGKKIIVVYVFQRIPFFSSLPAGMAAHQS
jgi:hypothetical protein